MKIPDNLIPLIYLLATAGIAGGLYLLNTPPEVIGILIGAGVTRVKKSTDKETL